MRYVGSERGCVRLSHMGAGNVRPPLREENPERGEIETAMTRSGYTQLRKEKFRSCFYLLAGFCAIVAGCRDNMQQATVAQLSRFTRTVPADASVDASQLDLAKAPDGPYRVVAGDVLQLEMPALAGGQAGDSSGDITAASQAYRCRVRDDGAITLPIVGKVPVTGHSLSEIETAVVGAYYPKYVKTSLPVYASVIEHKTYRVSIVGAVNQPGIYRLRHDQMSAVGLLMEAGNVVDEGAAVIQISRSQTTGQSARETANPARLILPVRGLNIPFADVALHEGDTVTVQRPYEQSVAVVGLVTRPGNMPYPLDARYRLIDAIAYAGGLDLVADPRYVTVYRLQADGTVDGVTLQLVDPKEKQHLTEALSFPLRPGDIVSVESTPRTRAKVFFDRIFRITLGLYFTPDTLWRDND